ncbi:hypothetical protein PRIPAC_75295 [Pristionchus pacificus]|uniref:Uncharacterized protein n=1 Tax=Pristionchus pacificus TaxID=54126 RepID=A0A2A6BEK3_PRIPA|nr:hypothetical protein PRIPAC_75295 [Pristionchus pacificus]|eukprot:PDM64298.1 hypothetical protein PRIPAC_52554 [Pristionchus pacificus]
MGSKRRHDDEDEVSLKKRRKREDSNGEIATTHETPDKKKRKSKGHELEENGKTNGDVSHSGEEDQFDAYLIRFPKSITVEEVQHLLSLKKKVKSRTKTMELSNGQEYTVRVTPNETVMYHVRNVDGQLTAGSRITGTVTITEQKEMKMESHFITHHDFLEDPPADIEMPFVIQPIKRTPSLELNGLKQRLHAYGCKSADSEQTPRKVKKAKRKSQRADDDE